ncbi:MAG: 16S rRNA (cytosine(1402)-N(4))-methyltransferase RsmH [Bacteroidetes bacterium]|nr:MAG: 16S rRNA (cytosine(1402)-N(4))-methyltransferase RsmH [Bacteroidota bacterium]
MTYHRPVLLHACIDGLNIKTGGTYIDATFGGGGHSLLILEKLKNGKLIAFDHDTDAEKNVPEDERILFINQNFRYMKNFLKLYGLIPVDGILADLGISSWQIDVAERGFSTRFEGPLDMRMDKQSKLSAKEVINDYSYDRLVEIFKLYGELRIAHKIAREIEFVRKNEGFETTEQLKNALKKLAPRGKENKFFAQVFQALRIEVNNELDALKEFLNQSVEVLKPGGRLVVVSYHSLEDRLVKNFIKAGNFEGELEKDFFGNIIAPLQAVEKFIIPDKDEMHENPRSRSAKLRIAEKTA